MFEHHMNSNETGLNGLAQFNQSAIDDHSNELIKCSEDSNIVSIDRNSLIQGVELDCVVYLVGGENKFGFSLFGANSASRFPTVDGISRNSAVSRADVRVGDEVLAVNGATLRHSTHEHIITSIHKSIQNRELTLRLKRPAESFPTSKTNQLGAINLVSEEDSLPARNGLSVPVYNSLKSQLQTTSFPDNETKSEDIEPSFSSFKPRRPSIQLHTQEKSLPCQASDRPDPPSPNHSERSSSQHSVTSFSSARSVTKIPSAQIHNWQHPSPSSPPNLSRAGSDLLNCSARQSRIEPGYIDVNGSVNQNTNTATPNPHRTDTELKNNSEAKEEKTTTESNKINQDGDDSASEASDSLNESQIPPASLLKSWDSGDTLHLVGLSQEENNLCNSSDNRNSVEDSGLTNGLTNLEELNQLSTYKRRYKKKNESLGSRNTLESVRSQFSQRLKLESSDTNQQLASSDQNTLDFDLNRPSNYPKNSNLTAGEEIEMQTMNAPVMASHHHHGFSDVDFMRTSEPVLSRTPFIEAQKGRKPYKDQFTIYNGFDHRMSQVNDTRVMHASNDYNDYREMPIDVPGVDPNSLVYNHGSPRTPSTFYSDPNHYSPPNYHGHERRPEKMSQGVNKGTNGPNRNPFANPNSGSSPQMFFDERLTETTSVGGAIESPDEEARRVLVQSSNNQFHAGSYQYQLPPSYSSAERRRAHQSSMHSGDVPNVSAGFYSEMATVERDGSLSKRGGNMKQDMQYTELDFSQIPNLVSSLPAQHQQDRDSLTLQSALSSEAFKRSLVHFDAINRVSNNINYTNNSNSRTNHSVASPARPFSGHSSGMGSGRGLIDEDEDDEDRASSVFGERLFTPPVGQGSSLVSSPATSRTGGGGGGVNVRPVTQNSLPTSQQIQDAIKNGQRGAGGIDSETGIELYRILDEENIQAVLKAHDQLAANNSRAAAGAIRQQFADEQHGRPVVTSFAAANSNGHLTPRQEKSLLSLRAFSVNGGGSGVNGPPTESSLMSGSEPPPEVVDRGEMRLVILQKSDHPLGATILKDGDLIRIGRVVKGGVIETSGVMKEGDELVKINDIELSRMSIDDVCDLLASLTGRVHFLLRPKHTTHTKNGVGGGNPGSPMDTLEMLKASRTDTATSIFDEQVEDQIQQIGRIEIVFFSEHSTDSGHLDLLPLRTTTQYARWPRVFHFQLHVRALFDFDPEDDEYVPCRELGIPFDRGTVLHVMNTQDANWWQAFPDHVIGLSAAGGATGTDSESAMTGSLLAIQSQNSLAGLIPSHKFWKKREALRLMIETTNQHHESMNESSSRRGGGALCCGSGARGRRGNNRVQSRLGGGPQVNPSAIQVLSYEEVGLYRPETGVPRPVVLVGPSKIGRLDLRQRLVSKQPHAFAAAVPHTTRAPKPSERDGVDYHFVNKQVFRAKLDEGEILDHYEVERHLYGTSVSAIRTVARNNKACMLCLHPKTIAGLRNALVMPFVVFIAPPGFEQLRIVSRDMGNTLRDNELRAVIEEARVMDLQYGHLFDDVIVNNGLEECVHQLSMLCDKVRTEPQWVPVQWLGKQPSPILHEDEH